MLELFPRLALSPNFQGASTTRPASGCASATKGTAFFSASPGLLTARMIEGTTSGAATYPESNSRGEQRDTAQQEEPHRHVVHREHLNSREGYGPQGGKYYGQVETLVHRHALYASR